MRRRYLLRTLAASSVIGTGVGIGTIKTNLVQPVQAQSDRGWYQEAKISVDDVKNVDNATSFVRFGYPVGLSSDGTTAVIGGVREFENDDVVGPGSIYVFSGSNPWDQVTEISTDDVNEFGSVFMRSIAVSSDGTRIIIGSKADENSDGSYDGSVYVFNGEGQSWNQETRLTADDGDSSDEFGQSIGMSDDTTMAVIGAPEDEDPNGEAAGSAYVFNGEGDSWNQETKIYPNDGNSDDKFGQSVAISDDGRTVLVGAKGEEDPNGQFAGSAYIFEKSDSSWKQEAKLFANDGENKDNFGLTVDLSGDGTTVVIGSNDDPNGMYSGSVYVFEKGDSSWNQEVKLIPDDGSRLDNFGRSLAISNDGTTIISGASGDAGPDGGFGAGSAYIFNKIGDSWIQVAKLTKEDRTLGDEFGRSIAVSANGKKAIIGANEDSSTPYIGAYVFSSSNTSESIEITESSLDPQDVVSHNSTHTFSIIAQNVSADGTGEEFADEFNVMFPEEVILEGYSNVNIDAQFSAVEQSGNTLTFSVSPSGGGTTQVSVEMDVTLSPANSQ